MKKKSRTTKEGMKREENRKKQGKEARTDVAITFDVPRSNNHWLSAEASAPAVFVRLSASFQERRIEKRGKRREENKEKKGERCKQHRRMPDERRQQRIEKKKGIANRPSKLSFIPSFCMHFCICYYSSEI